jgi:putative transposase
MVKVISINLPKCTDLDNVNFLIAASNVFICTEAARCCSSISNAPSHDCFTRLLQKQPSDIEPLWDEVGKFVTPKEGYLIADDTVLINLILKRWILFVISGVGSIIELLRELV